MAARLPMRGGHPSRLFGFIVNFQLPGFDLGCIYECEFPPDFAATVRNQNVGLGVCTYETVIRI
jgi:hypothetical protein